MSNVFNKKFKLFSTNFQGNFLPLSEAKTGRSYVVQQLIMADENARRLISVGVCPGAVVTPMFVAPLGNPTAYLVAGAKIAFARACARNIIVSENRAKGNTDK